MVVAIAAKALSAAASGQSVARLAETPAEMRAFAIISKWVWLAVVIAE